MLTKVVPGVVLRQQPEEESLNLPSTKNKFPKQHKYQNQRKNTRKTTLNEVRPWCLRPRGNEREILLIL